MLTNIIYLPVTYIIAVLLHRFTSIRKNTTFAPSLLVIPVGLMLVFLLFGYIGVANWNNPKIDDNVYSMAIVFIFILFCFSIFFLYDKVSNMYQDKLQLALEKKEREYYFAQCQLMQKSVEQVKVIRHDMKLHLATVRGYSSAIQADEITAYVDSLLGEIGEGQLYSDTGNIAFDSIINFKLQNMREDNIKLDVNLLIPQSLHMEVTDVVTILGNLLDNALSAVSKVEDKRLKIDVLYNRKSLFIQIENTFDGIVGYTDGKKKGTKQLKTRKTSGDHGYGLKNVRKCVEKYNGQMDITHEGKVFSVAIILYVQDNELGKLATAKPVK